jgi:hypothetical protein
VCDFLIVFEKTRNIKFTMLTASKFRSVKHIYIAMSPISRTLLSYKTETLPVEQQPSDLLSAALAITLCRFGHPRPLISGIMQSFVSGSSH